MRFIFHFLFLICLIVETAHAAASNVDTITSGASNSVQSTVVEKEKSSETQETPAERQARLNQIRPMVTKGLFDGIHKGNKTSVSLILSKPLVDADIVVKDKTPLLYTLSCVEDALGALQPKTASWVVDKLDSYQHIVGQLLEYGATAGNYCPIFDALLNGNVGAARQIGEKLNMTEAYVCLTSIDELSRTIFHVVAATPAVRYAQFIRKLSDINNRTVHERIARHFEMIIPEPLPNGAVPRRQLDSMRTDADIQLLLQLSKRHDIDALSVIMDSSEDTGSAFRIACRDGQLPFLRAVLHEFNSESAEKYEEEMKRCVQIAQQNGFDDVVSLVSSVAKANGAEHGVDLMHAPTTPVACKDGKIYLPFRHFQPSLLEAAGWHLANGAELMGVGLAGDFWQSHVGLVCPPAANKLRTFSPAQLPELLAAIDFEPVVLKADVNLTSWMHCRGCEVNVDKYKQWDVFAGTFGDQDVDVVSIRAGPNMLDIKQKSVKLGSYIQQNLAGRAASVLADGSSAGSAGSPPLVMDAKILHKPKTGLKQYFRAVPSQLLFRERQQWKLMVSPPLAGLHPQLQPRSSNLQLSGLTLWALVQPSCAVDVVATASEWFRSTSLAEYNTLSGCKVFFHLQEPGEVLVVPAYWQQISVSLTDTVGMRFY